MTFAIKGGGVSSAIKLFSARPAKNDQNRKGEVAGQNKGHNSQMFKIGETNDLTILQHWTMLNPACKQDQ